MMRFMLGGLLTIFFALGSAAEVFVADFNNDGMPDILIAEGSMASNFTLLLNEGAGMDGVKFRKTSVMPMSGTMMPVAAGQTAGMPKAYDRQEARRPYYMNQQNTPTTPQPEKAMPPSGVQTPMSPPALKPISAGSPQLKPAGGWGGTQTGQAGTKMDAMGAPMEQPGQMMSGTGGSMKPAGGWGMQEPLSAPATPAPMPPTGGPGSVAVYNFQDMNNGDNLQWLEAGIANILKFDVLELKNVRLTERERTSTAFNAEDYVKSGINASYVVTGMFKREADRLKIMTKIINGADGKTVIREYEVEGDPADVFSVIEKVGIQLKRELTSL